MKSPLLLKHLLFYCSLFISNILFSQAANNTCATATDLGTLTGNYIATSGDLYLANQTSPTGSTCGNRYDVWYRFTMPAGSTIAIITVNLKPTFNQTLTNNNTYIEVFNTNNCTVNGTSTGGCNTIAAPRRYTLTAGQTYYFRVNTTVNPNTLSPLDWGFNVWVMPFNDNCNGIPTILQPGSSLDGSALAATNSAVAVGSCGGVADDDVWYTFNALYSYHTLTLSNIGADLNASGARMQLFSGSCGSLTAVAGSSCSGTTNIINATGLTVGNPYFVRVYGAGTGQTGTAWGFRISLSPSAKVVTTSSRMREIYHQQIISAPQILNDPWEVTYGPDNNLWLTESKGYRIYKMDPLTGVRDTILDISQGSTFLAVADQTFNCQFANGAGAQGGLAGMALHPNFLNGLPSEKNFVYISYIRTNPSANFYVNRVARFTYNKITKRLEAPVSLCDTLPGSNDHNSQRMFIAPIVKGGTQYLFYASGDMGSGQGTAINIARPIKSQHPRSYEGKILRFNLETDGEGGLNGWIPNDNPYSTMLGVQSAVWSIGIRNNQGFAYDTASNVLFGSSHGPYSDDEINVIKPFRNYGHPLVIGYVADGNYNGTTSASTSTSISAGCPFPVSSGNSTCPPIGTEAAQRAAIDANGNGLYKDPLFSAYPGPASGTTSVSYIWANNPNNGLWPSEGWSGLDFYSNKVIPGWKRSLVASSLKWGRLVRIKLADGDSTTLPNNTINDTISYFGSQNRFRDLAFAPNGKDIYVIMDKSTTTSGPSALFPVVPACQGCLQKYTFLGYADAAGKSTIPASIDVTDSVTANKVIPGTPMTIDATNNTLWVPITGPDGNIMAEINAMGQNLGLITSAFYKHSGAVRIKNGVHYLDRNITITPAVTSFAIPVKVRLYISKAEYNALDADPLSGLSGAADIALLRVLKNSDTCGGAVYNSTTMITPTNTGVDLVHGANGYVLQANISGFSSFYFATGNITLPVTLLSFTGSLQNNATLLNWETANEINTSHFIVERSIDNASFDGIGTVAANGTTSSNTNYSYTDNDVTTLPSNVIYYRLKMVDIDGSSKYSNTIIINLADIAGRVSVYPNPASHSIKVMITAVADGKGQWKITDNSGRVVMQSTSTLRKGNNNVVIDINKLAAGLYYLNVSGPGVDQKVKLQKL